MTAYSSSMQLQQGGMLTSCTCSSVMELLRRSLTWYSLCHHLPVTNRRRRFSSQAMPAHDAWGCQGRQQRVIAAQQHGLLFVE